MIFNGDVRKYNKAQTGKNRDQHVARGEREREERAYQKKTECRGRGKSEHRERGHRGGQNEAREQRRRQVTKRTPEDPELRRKASNDTVLGPW